jgi:hypothetical protein
VFKTKSSLEINILSEIKLQHSLSMEVKINVQHVAGELMMFWSELGFVFGKFPFVGWTRGWYADDTENNLNTMKGSQQMHQDIMRTTCDAHN